MPVQCPKCGSRNLRFSRSRVLSEKLKKLLGIHALRCRDCHTRFVDRTWRLSDVAFARCPKCWRMDLSHWSKKDFHAPGYMSLALRLGAHPYRCEYCRYNFVSFRQRKERFSFHRGLTPAERVSATEHDDGPAPATRLAEAKDARRRPFQAPAPAPPEKAGPAPGTAAEAIAWRKAQEGKRRDAV